MHTEHDGLGYREFVGNLFARFGEVKNAEASRHLAGAGRAPTDLARTAERLRACEAAEELKRTLEKDMKAAKAHTKRWASLGASTRTVSFLATSPLV